MAILVLAAACYIAVELGRDDKGDAQRGGGTVAALPDEIYECGELKRAKLRGESWVRVLWVIDGDTIVVETIDPKTRVKSEEHVRLIGVSAPEIRKKNGKGENEPGGVEAAKWVEQELAADAQVELEYDKERLDKYDRTLAYVWYEKNGQRRMLNEELIYAGLAKPMRVVPNVKYHDRFLEAHKQAKR